MNEEPDAIVERMLGLISDRVPELTQACFRVWEADEHLDRAAPSHDQLDATISPQVAYWRGYRQCAVDLMETLIGPHLANDEVPWRLRHTVISGLIQRLTAHT